MTTLTILSRGYAGEADLSLEGHIGLLGTRRGYRGIGLGRAILLAGLRALATAGAESAYLSVDADSPTGATRLYESAGFRTTLTRMVYGKEIDL